jgi:hypothetical protein
MVIGGVAPLIQTVSTNDDRETAKKNFQAPGTRINYTTIMEWDWD